VHDEFSEIPLTVKEFVTNPQQISRDNLDENGATIWMRRGSRAEG
jgi:hypothetical protein